MLKLAAVAQPLSLQCWLRLPRDRVRLVRRFVGMAITLAVAKVFLNTVGFALFLANDGPSQLPRFYMLLALVAIALSTALSIVVDRMPKLRVARATLVATMMLAGSGKLMIDAGLAGAYVVILSCAFIFEIAIEILFWAACASYLDSMELKRATPLICLGIALGGALGGLFARMLAWTIDAPDLLLAMFVFACLTAIQFTFPADVQELPDRPTEDDAAGRLTVLALGGLRACMRYPLLILVALNALTLTILYGIAEFLILSVYSEHYPEEQELTRFLGIVFALLQGCEFLLLASLGRVLLERTSPLVRNLVFPLTSLACLLYLAFSNKLSAAVITHVNAEAASNAIFQPIHNANFLALPLAVQGRARTLSEGIFYPAGLAIAGALLWSMGVTGATTAAKFVAVLFALVFILNNVGVAVLFLPTLIASVRSGVVPLAELGGRIIALPAAASDRVRELLRSSLPELRLDGIALCRWLGAAHVTDDLVALASHPDTATCRALVRLAIEDDGPWVRGFVDAAFDRDDRSSMVAMQIMLAHRQAPSARQAELVQSANPSVSVLAWLLLEGSDASAAFGRLAPLLHHPQVAADVIEVIVAARREDCIRILVAALPAAPADQQRHGLEFLRLTRTDLSAPSWWVLGRFTRHRDLRVRTEAMALLGRCHHRAARRALSRGLVDWNPLVRRRASEALAAQGEGAVGLLRERLLALTLGSAEAAGALSTMTSRPARDALIGSLQSLHREARDNARLHARLAAVARAAPWLGLATCARDHEARIANIALAVLRGSLQHHVFGHVRDALGSEDRRRRANAFEILAALPRSGPVAEAVATLRFLLFEGSFGAQEAEPPDRFDGPATLAVARRSRSPWVREAARIVEARTSIAGPGLAPVPRAQHTIGHGSREMILDEQDLDRALALKRIPLFRYLSLDTLLAVSRAMQSRRYLPGDVIAKAGERLEYCLILEAGAVSFGRGPTTESLSAPACLNEVVLVDEVMPIGPIVALEPCRVLRLHAVVLQDLSRDHPEILLELCRILAHRIRVAEGAHGGEPVATGNGRERTGPAGQPPCAEPWSWPENQANLAPKAYKSHHGMSRIFALLRAVRSRSYFGNE